MKMAPGRRFILRMPPSVPWSLFISSVSLAASFLVIRSKSPFCWRASSCSSRPIRFLMVMKLVSMPPSQRLLTYGWLARVASWATGSWACFLVPTNRTWSPRATVSRTNSSATSRRWTVWARSMMWIPLRSAKMNGRHLGVPAAGLVAEVDSGFQQLPHRDGRHGGDLLSVRSSADPVAGGRWPGALQARPGRNGPRVSSTPVLARALCGRTPNGGCGPNSQNSIFATRSHPEAWIALSVASQATGMGQRADLPFLGA